ncbi:MAG: acyl carrier protein [Gammaproteobacteria bacterium]|nr:acyl carrier protein [Gammaproteobacteria bacterium]
MNHYQSSTESIVRGEFRKLLREDYEGDIDVIPLADLGIDSLDFFDKLLYLEEEHGISIPVQELDSSITLEELLTILKS